MQCDSGDPWKLEIETEIIAFVEFVQVQSSMCRRYACVVESAAQQHKDDGFCLS